MLTQKSTLITVQARVIVWPRGTVRERKMGLMRMRVQVWVLLLRWERVVVWKRVWAEVRLRRRGWVR